MTSPPALVPAPMPRVEQISAESVLSTRTQQMRFLVQELGITRQQAHRLLKAYEADLRDEAAVKSAHADAVAAGGFADAAQVARDTFRQWVKARAVKQWSGEQRIRMAMAR